MFPIIRFETLPSTQQYLIDEIKKEKGIVPCAVVAIHQTQGVGSRGNQWESFSGNLYTSFVLNKDQLPNDLMIHSASIYFGVLLVQILQEYDEHIWLKWPNDIYKNHKKCGGLITTLVNNYIICGLGLNTSQSDEKFESLDLPFDNHTLLKKYFEALDKLPTWKEVFSNFSIQFQRNKTVFATIEGEKVSIKDAFLNQDGSLTINGKKVYSLR